MRRGQSRCFSAAGARSAFRLILVCHTCDFELSHTLIIRESTRPWQGNLVKQTIS